MALLSFAAGYYLKEILEVYHPGGNPGANLKSISHRCHLEHRCHLFEVAFVGELTKETIYLPLGCLQGGWRERRGGVLKEELHVALWGKTATCWSAVCLLLKNRAAPISLLQHQPRMLTYASPHRGGLEAGSP